MVLLDIKLPRRDGFEVVEAIHAFHDFWLSRCALPDVEPAAVHDA